MEGEVPEGIILSCHQKMNIYLCVLTSRKKIEVVTHIIFCKNFSFMKEEPALAESSVLKDQ